MSLPAQPDAVSAWRAIRAELARLVGTSAYEIWLAPIELESFDGDVLLLAAPAGDPEVAGRTASGPCSTAAYARSSARRRGSSSTGIRVRVATHPPGDLPAPDAARGDAQPPLPLRAVRHRRGQPSGPRRRARRRRVPRPGLQPAVSPCAPGPGQDPPSPRDRQLRRRLRRRHDGPLHDRRGLHQPLHQRAEHASHSAPSSTPTATPTSCSSTTSSSWPARPRPRRSSSTPSTRSTRTAGSWCSPATASRGRSSRSSSGCASASRPASSPTSSPPTTPLA